MGEKGIAADALASTGVVSVAGDTASVIERAGTVVTTTVARAR